LEYDEGLKTLYCKNLAKRFTERWIDKRSTYGESRRVYRVLVGEPEGKRPLGRLRRRWEDNIKMDLQEVSSGEHGLDRAGSG